MTDETNDIAAEIDAAAGTAVAPETPVAEVVPAEIPAPVANEEPVADVAQDAGAGEDVPQDFSGAVDQGRSAKDLGLTEDACPYGVGANRDAWLAGFAE